MPCVRSTRCSAGFAIDTGPASLGYNVEALPIIDDMKRSRDANAFTFGAPLSTPKVKRKFLSNKCLPGRGSVGRRRRGGRIRATDKRQCNERKREEKSLDCATYAF